MEVANAGFDSMKRFMTGFRMPDLSRLWVGLDETDHPPSQVPLIIKLEYYLVRCQELVLWTDPKASLVALTAIHLAFGYLATTSNTALNLTLWTVLSGKSIILMSNAFELCELKHCFAFRFYLHDMDPENLARNPGSRRRWGARGCWCPVGMDPGLP